VEKELLIGAHASTAGGLHNALLEGESIGATTIQMFTRNQRRWSNKPLDDAEVATWKNTLESTGLSTIMSHGSYLVNLGAPDVLILEKSRKAFVEEVDRCVALGLSFLTFHPGSSVGGDTTKCLDTIVESLERIADIIDVGSTRLLLETTAGQGSVIGWRFEELAYIIERVDNILPIGVCVDTCHIFAAGYDIRTLDMWEATLDEFDDVVGIENLYAFHLNDSMKGIGTRRDRHAPLGEGEIGIDCFKAVMNESRTRLLPKYLETPGGPGLWKKEINMLRTFAKK